ncbi:50S ribosomal protein L13 [bacterium]|nr:50S ribosomal protein L13 [bacterium]|tara:strand:- start:188 stop:550 length:363 start_codon:yes stop_codon:yes gene_type:complete
MVDERTTKEYIIDAKGRRLGKVATEAATYLMGKNQPDFAKHVLADVHVKIENVSLLDIPEKRKGEIYQSYSGYPGGRSTETLEHLGERLGYDEVVRRTVKGMLPKNKMQSLMMKNLQVSE